VNDNFGKNRAAMAYFTSEYRKPWVLPKI
jgi:hypothetical protein